MATTPTSTPATSTKKSNLQLVILPLLVGLILSGFFQYWRHEKAKEKHAYANTDAGMLELKIEYQKELNQAPKSPAPPTVKVTEVVATFPCPTIEARDAGFRSSSAFSLEKKDTTYLIPNGCVSITLTGDALRSLSRVQVSGEFLFRQASASEPTGYVGCGKMPSVGANHSPIQCLNFLREKSGQVVEVINASDQIIID